MTTWVVGLFFIQSCAEFPSRMKAFCLSDFGWDAIHILHVEGTFSGLRVEGLCFPFISNKSKGVLEMYTEHNEVKKSHWGFFVLQFCLK